MKRSRSWLAGVFLLAAAVAASTADPESYAKRIAALIDPAKLATLGERGANPRVQKYVAQLAEAREAGIGTSNVASRAVALAGMKREAAKLTTDAMLRNLTIAERLGCLGDVGLRDMRQGKAPTIQRGPYKGDELSVDHIIPVAVCPELDRVIANLELMPLRLNEGKRDTVGARQRALARELHAAGLLSDEGLRAVMKGNTR
jgi:hypothetical protein